MNPARVIISAFAVAVLFGRADGQSPVRDTVRLNKRMTTFMKARQFRDAEAMHDLFDPVLHAEAASKLSTIHDEFRSKYPDASLSYDSPELKAFLQQRSPSEPLDSMTVDLIGSAFSSLEAGKTPDEAGWSLWMVGLLPGNHIMVDSGRFEFARWQDNDAVFYATEFQRRYVGFEFTERFTVVWMRREKQWFVSMVR